MDSKTRLPEDPQGPLTEADFILHVKRLQKIAKGFRLGLSISLTKNQTEDSAPIPVQEYKSEKGADLQNMLTKIDDNLRYAIGLRLFIMKNHQEFIHSSLLDRQQHTATFESLQQTITDLGNLYRDTVYAYLLESTSITQRLVTHETELSFNPFKTEKS